MPFAAALSVHPDPAVAVGEATGQVLEALGDEPVDLAILFTAGRHGRALGDAADVVRTLLRPSGLLGATAWSVLAAGREVEERAAVTLWAGRFGEVHPTRLGPGDTDPPFAPSALLLLADPFTFVAEPAFATLAERWPGLPVIGGMASAARGPGGNRLVLDDHVVRQGAVGVFLGPGVEVEPVVSQGCRPVGQPFTVTAAAAATKVVHELAGRPAAERLLELANDRLTPEEVEIVAPGGLLVGRVVDGRKGDAGRGDFLIRGLVGVDHRAGSIALADDVAIGDTLQFHLRDADAADDDLRAMLNGRSAEAALVFTDLGRGVHLFDAPHHDAAVVDEYLGRPATAGMFCAGEFGPVGGGNFAHGLTASMALLRERPGVR